MSCLACSFCFFVVMTSHFPDVDDIYVFLVFVINGRFSSISFNLEYTVSSSML